MSEKSQGESAKDVKDLALAAKAVALELAGLPAADKNEALEGMAAALEAHKAKILAANQLDVKQAEADGMSKAMIDRLSLDEKRLADLAAGVRQIAALPDPVGELLETFDRPNGLRIEKIRVPLGLIAIIYEARPNVTADAAALALKSGNCVLLRGSSSALASNQALVAIMKSALSKSKIPPAALMLVENGDRASVSEMLGLQGFIDAVIPRGGADLIQRVVHESKIPVLETGVGVCHVYVDSSAKLDMAASICFNAKVQRPSVCNAAETFLFHKAIAPEMVQRLFPRLFKARVEIRGDHAIQALSRGVIPAKDTDFGAEFLDLIVAVKVVENVKAACAHIRRYGTLHTEAIIAEDPETQEQFIKGVDAAAVMVNASTRFTDGGEFGFGAEMGISTQKLHARGPMGLRELCTYKYIVRGDGQVRS